MAKQHDSIEEEKVEAILKPNANTLSSEPRVTAGNPSKVTHSLQPVEQWARLKRTKEYMYSAVLARMGWKVGKQVSEAEYEKALSALRGTRNG